MAMEPLDQDETRFNKPTLQTEPDHCKKENKSKAFTCNAPSLLIFGVMRRGGCVDGTAQLRRLLVGRRLYELDGRLEDSELQGHSHF